MSQPFPNIVRDAYIACALWASTVSDPLSSDDDDMVSLDDLSLTAADLHPDLAAKVDADLSEFHAATTEADRDLFGEEFGLAAIGHDLWLTRNGHGAGFWSRPGHRDGAELEEASARLAAAARALGEDVWYPEQAHIDAPTLVVSYI